MSAVTMTQTVVPARYLGHEYCYYKAGDMNDYCRDLVHRFLLKRKEKKSKLAALQRASIHVSFNFVLKTLLQA